MMLATMDMGSMLIDGFLRMTCLSKKVKFRSVSVLFLYSVGHQEVLQASELTITPTATFQEIYSDNINLSSTGNEKNAFVTELSPGLSIVRRSARSTLNLNYRMQNLYNSGGNGGLKVFNQLQYNSHNIFIPNRLFLDSRSSIGQQNINNNRLGNDNISGAGNSTTVSTFGVSPYWTPHFGNVANGNVRVNADTVTTGSGATVNQNTNFGPTIPISDSVNLSEILSLTSGTYFKRINWNLSFNNSESFRDIGQNTQFQNASGLVRTYINKYFNVFAQGGYSNNSFQSINNRQSNGAFYTVGGQWTPSQHYSIEAGAGNNSHITVSVSPIQRLSWVTTYRDNSVGLNSGKTWQTALNYKTRQSTWSVTHDNDTVTSQQLLLQHQVFSSNPTDPAGPVVIDPNNRPINNGYLSNEVIVRKIWRASVTYLTGKSTWSAGAYSQNSEYQTNGIKQEATGLNGSWNWQFASKTSAYLRPQWQQTKYATAKNSDQYYTDQYYDVAIGLNRSITPMLNGRLEFRHLNQSSKLNSNNYEENRATASLFMRF